MHSFGINFAYTFIPIFVAMDLPGLVPIFVSLTQGLPPAQTRRVGLQALFTAFAISVVFVLIGKSIFQIIGIIAIRAGYLPHYLVLFTFFCKVSQPAVA